MKARPVPKVLIASAAFMPWCLFVSTTIDLYLRNRSELHHQFRYMLPLLVGGGAVFLVALGVAMFASKSRLAARAEASLRLFGLSFLLFNITPREGWSPYVEAAYGALGLSLAIAVGCAMYQRINSLKVRSLFAVLLVGFITVDAAKVLLAPKPSPSFTGDPLPTQKSDLRTSGADLPNVYHVILDSYQSDDFTTTLTDQVRSALPGFTYFSNNVSIFLNTQFSVTSVFAARGPKGFKTQKDYKKSAYSAPAPLLSALRRRGYEVVCFNCGTSLPKDRLGLQFDYQFDTEGEKWARWSAWDDSVVLLWARAYLPKLLTTNLARDRDRTQFERANESAKLTPVFQVEGFRDFLRVEPLLQAHGRYTFLHLIVPHDPFVLNSDCTYNEGYAETSKGAQSSCATKLITELVATIKDLGRYDNSLIVIHADHGFGSVNDTKVRLREIFGRDFDESITSWMARISALLLVKPVGANKPFSVDPRFTNVLDVAPTILAATGSEISPDMEGKPLPEGRGSKIPDAIQFNYETMVGLNSQNIDTYELRRDGAKVIETHEWGDDDRATNDSSSVIPLFDAETEIKIEAGKLIDQAELQESALVGTYLSRGGYKYRIKVKQGVKYTLSLKMLHRPVLFVSKILTKFGNGPTTKSTVRTNAPIESWQPVVMRRGIDVSGTELNLVLSCHHCTGVDSFTLIPDDRAN